MVVVICSGEIAGIVNCVETTGKYIIFKFCILH